MKFQVTYEVKTDREATFEKAFARGLKPRRVGGRTTKGGESPGAQVRFRLEDFDATVLVGPNVVQVSWPGDYEDIVKIELLLDETVVLMPNEVSGFGGETRKDVPNIRMFEHQMEGLREDIDHYKWKERMDYILGRAVKIKNGRIDDYLTCNTRQYLETAWIILSMLEKLIEIGRQKGWEIKKRASENRARLNRVINRARRSSRDSEIIKALEKDGEYND